MAKKTPTAFRNAFYAKLCSQPQSSKKKKCKRKIPDCAAKRRPTLTPIPPARRTCALQWGFFPPPRRAVGSLQKDAPSLRPSPLRCRRGAERPPQHQREGGGSRPRGGGSASGKGLSSAWSPAARSSLLQSHGGVARGGSSKCPSVPVSNGN